MVSEMNDDFTDEPQTIRPSKGMTKATKSTADLFKEVKGGLAAIKNIFSKSSKSSKDKEKDNTSSTNSTNTSMNMGKGLSINSNAKPVDSKSQVGTPRYAIQSLPEFPLGTKKR
jgi:hypothetical protein